MFPPLRVRGGLGRGYFILFVSIFILSCQSSPSPDILHYTCPMHPQIRADAPGQCPICQMDLVPVFKEKMEKPNGDGGHGTHEADKDSSASGIFVDPTYTQRIGVMSESVQKRQLRQEILTYGKLAHDKDLWVAQNEYIEAIKLGDASLIKSSELKLKFLGLSEDWIATLRRTRSADLSLHLHVKEEDVRPSYVEAYVYQDDIARVKQGQEAEILDQQGRQISLGTVRALGTLVDLSSRAIRVLIEARGPLNLRLNTFVQIRLSMPLGEKLSLNREAVLFNGDHTMVYVDRGEGHFEARVVLLGEQGGDFYEVREGLSEGEKVVLNGHFLIDSETRIRGGESGHKHP